VAHEGKVKALCRPAKVVERAKKASQRRASLIRYLRRVNRFEIRLGAKIREFRQRSKTMT